MVYMFKLKIAVLLSVLLPAGFLLLWSDRLWTSIVFAVWIIVAAALWIKIDRVEHAKRLDRSMKALQQTAIRMLNHHRHDWMNDLQVLYGYIRMNKTDKIVTYVEKIRERMVIESRISKLGVPALVLYLHFFRTASQTLQLDVNIEDELNLSELPVDNGQLSEAIIALINAYRFAIRPGQGDAARLTMGIAKRNNSLRLSFCLQGDLSGPEELYRQFKEKLKGTPIHEIHIDPLMTEVQLQVDLHS